jgi:hypothetical protein
LRLKRKSISVPKTTEVLIVVIVIIIYKDWAFWPVPIPRLAELVPPSPQWSASPPFFLFGGNKTASEEFGQLIFLRCVRSNFVDNHLLVNIDEIASHIVIRYEMKRCKNELWSNRKHITLME